MKKHDDSQTIDMKLDGRTSRYLLGPLACLELPRFVRGGSLAYLVDATVADLHAPWLENIRAACPGDRGAVFRLPPGERAKTMAVLDEVYGWLAGLALPRDGTIVGVGGGAALDLAGMAAATWRRGVDYVAIPTTLLAMVDASLGGKTGLNTAGLKNPVGCFHPAEAILADAGFLATLPRRRWREGMAELIKTAAIGDRGLFLELHARREELAGHLRDGADDEPIGGMLGALPWREWIGRAASVKADLVTRDFRERGPRRALNLGHTLGHVLEALSMEEGAGPGAGLGHGQAVAIGMAVVFRIAAERGSCPVESAVQMLETLEACGLPTTWTAPAPATIDRLLAGDKKGSARAGLRWVLPERIGKMDLAGRVSTEEILRWLDPPA